MDDSLLILVHFRFGVSGLNKNNTSWGLLQSQEHFEENLHVIRAFRIYPHCHSWGLYNDLVLPIHSDFSFFDLWHVISFCVEGYSWPLLDAGRLTGSPLTRPTSTLCCWSSSWNSGTTRLSERTGRRWARNWECSLHKPVIIYSLYVISNPYSFHLRLSNLIHTSAHLNVRLFLNILQSIFFSFPQMKESHAGLD